ncbi:MAG TPA: spore germination protein GerW family protein [Acidobacteriota bacterium]|nr:spore germination protein GerW family protein [Acidobacteriota bacterium]
MRTKLIALAALAVMLAPSVPAGAQTGPKAAAKPPLPMDQLVEAMTQRLANSLQVKTVTGAPIKAGKVTLVPVIMVDIGFGGGGVSIPQSPEQGGKGFYMSGEARPLGFIVITKSGAQFISVGKVPKK